MKEILQWPFLTTVLFSLFACNSNEPKLVGQEPVAGLIQRILPAYTEKFQVEIVASDSADWFELESKDGKIHLRGNNGVSVASAFYYYLTEYGHCQITWNGTNLNLPSELPVIPEKVRKDSPYEYRYYLNYCTFNYSMSWWDWPRWEREIDWMALHGINMPLAITGEESIWDEVYRSYGFTDEDLDPFFCGPAYFAWFWMGNLDAWAGPLPKSWKDNQRLLQQKILQRERELGMKPVLPAFTGHVPASFKKYFPNAKLKQTNWGNDFDDTYILDANDPLFAEIGKKFLEVQQQVFGTDHLYSADTFNENEPPSNEPAYLSELSAKLFDGMKSADPEAVWVMQGWLFYSHREFWKAPQIKALLDTIPDDRMLILDLAAEIEPVWKRTEAFYGKEWIWNMLHNFGGNLSLFGRIATVAAQPAMALNDSASGQLKGIGLTMEAIEQNPVLYELMTDHTWRSTPIELYEWLPRYIRNRYGRSNATLEQAWSVLCQTVYNGQTIRDGAESIIVARPSFEGYRRWARTKLNYAAVDLLPAWDLLLGQADSCAESDGFRYDLVDLTRQVLANYALPVQQAFAEAWKNNDKAAFAQYSAEFLDLMNDMDRLLATRADFMLGPWLADARACGQTEQEKKLYEQNARDLISLWGGANNRLHEYSCRQWSGLISDFYRPRWEQFFAEVNQNWKQFDQKQFDKKIADWEWNWVCSQKQFPTEGTGSEILLAKELHAKYRDRLEPLTRQLKPIQYDY
ncbi:MAG: alpha-N-acetylglucosaminidase [Mangrovibacterium sp.]